MGVKSAFDYGDFGKLSKINKMKVTAIKHRAVIEVTKEGTIGVAATGVEIGVLSANLFPTFARFDKPFFFFVRDRRSENLLFAGYVNNPTL
jgi:serpin B